MMILLNYIIYPKKSKEQRINLISPKTLVTGESASHSFDINMLNQGFLLPFLAQHLHLH